MLALLDQTLYDLTEAVPSVDVALEEVKARTRWREEDGIARLSHRPGMLYRLLHREGRGDVLDLAMEGVVELQHVRRQEDESTCPGDDLLRDVEVVVPPRMST